MLSLLLPGWNEGENILRCVAGLQNQTYPHFNVFMILGGEDPVIEQARAMAWERLIILPQTVPNKNLALNQALSHPDLGDIVVLSDIDCEFPPDYLARYATQFADPARNVVAGRVQAFHRSGSALERYLINNEERRLAALPERGDFLVGANFAVRTSFLREKMGGKFDETVKSSTDACFLGALKHINEPVYLDKGNVIYSDFNADRPWRLIRQQSRWFKNVLVYGGTFHTKRALVGHLVLAGLSWVLFILGPLGLLVASRLWSGTLIPWGIAAGWLGVFGILWRKRLRDLNRGAAGAAQKIKNVLGSIPLTLFLAFIPLVGSVRAVASRDKTKSWKK
jgi:cellulose synthase/poly-beta-1,6-N-acetylglucosamine synthase-like glycosyltransferase